MIWTELLRSEIESVYRATGGLLDLVHKDNLGWKPSEGINCMTTGQRRMHLTIACDAPMRVDVAGDWGFPEGVDTNDFLQIREVISLSEEENLSLAEKTPAIGSVSEANALLVEDKQLAIDMLAECDEDNLDNQTSKAPWDETELILGHRLLHMVAHLKFPKHSKEHCDSCIQHIIPRMQEQLDSHGDKTLEHSDELAAAFAE